MRLKSTLYAVLVMVVLLFSSGGVEVKADDMQIFDREGAWNTQQKIQLIDDIIAPNSNGTYSFTLHNTGDSVKKYELVISDENEYEIPLQFRVTRNGRYVQDEEWHNTAEYESGVQLLQLNATEEFQVEWKWEFEGTDKKDTELGGQTELPVYYINLKVYAEGEGITIESSSPTVVPVPPTPVYTGDNTVALCVAITGVALSAIGIFAVFYKGRKGK